MIIARRYVPFVFLYFGDERSKEIIDEAYERMNISDEERELHWNAMCENRVSIDTADMSCCFPSLGYVREEFVRLDYEFPYDNGFSVADANEIQIIERTEDGIQVRLVKKFEGDEYIIGFVYLNDKNVLPMKESY